jgi:hypothetical protein
MRSTSGSRLNSGSKTGHWSAKAWLEPTKIRLSQRARAACGVRRAACCHLGIHVTSFTPADKRVKAFSKKKKKKSAEV